MCYLLLSRFRGGLIGSLLGETGGSFSQTQAELSSYEQNNFYRIRIWLATIEHLRRYGRLKQQNWEEICSIPASSRMARQNYDLGEIALIILPLIFYFHENTFLLSQDLAEAKNFWQQDDCEWEYLLLWAETIGLILREKPSPHYSFAELLKTVSPPSSSLLSQLDLLERLLSSIGTGLERVVSQLSRIAKPSQIPFLLALYCFSSTPEDFRLSALRASKINYPLTTAALTGTLAGVYNSYSNIPLSWRITGSKQSNMSEIQLATERLFALWCGVYEPETNYLTSYSAIASPNIIQRRSSNLS
jgi:hypothetical protein